MGPNSVGEDLSKAMLEIIALTGLVIAWLGMLSVWYFLHHLRVPTAQHMGSVSLILALTGGVPQLESLLLALSRQHLPPRRLIVAVESEDDPAFGRVGACIDQVSFPVLRVVAGLAQSSGQKSRNLLAALALIDDADEAVVLLDADVMPSPEWLGYLVSPVLAGNYDVVSGYRWLWLERWQPASLIVATIDRSIALLPRMPGYFMPWGGSTALGKIALQRIDRKRWLERSISDDCALGLEVNRLELRALLRRIVLVKSPIDDSGASLWAFGRRQYQMIRFYMPGLWLFAASMTVLRCSAWAFFFSLWGTEHAVSGLLAMYGATSLGLLLQGRVARRLCLEDAGSGIWTMVLLTLAKPLIDLFHLTLIAGAGWANVVTWGHVRYRVASRSDISILGRVSWKD